MSQENRKVTNEIPSLTSKFANSSFTDGERHELFMLEGKSASSKLIKGDKIVPISATVKTIKGEPIKQNIFMRVVNFLDKCILKLLVSLGLKPHK